MDWCTGERKIHTVDHDIAHTNGSVHRIHTVFRRGGVGEQTYPEPAIIFHHNISKVNPLPAAHKLPDLWVVVRADVVPDKVAVQAVPPAFLLVKQDVRR